MMLPSSAKKSLRIICVREAYTLTKWQHSIPVISLTSIPKQVPSPPRVGRFLIFAKITASIRVDIGKAYCRGELGGKVVVGYIVVPPYKVIGRIQITRFYGRMGMNPMFLSKSFGSRRPTSFDIGLQRIHKDGKQARFDQFVHVVAVGQPHVAGSVGMRQGRKSGRTNIAGLRVGAGAFGGQGPTG
eukprot:scaffold2987_cov170-Amphora_coffeaeformis.AAC.7